MRIAFLTLAERGSYVIDDELAYPALQRRGWEAVAVPWTAPDVAWEEFDLVVIRSTWDYHLDPERFLATLADIEASVELVNPRRVVEWNLLKTYLGELAAKGLAVVPTRFGDRLETGEVAGLAGTGERIVIKPQVGATAMGTYVIDGGTPPKVIDEIERYYLSTPYLLQPFIPEITTEGEYSVMFFDGHFSHAIVKRPRPNDFRSQEEHGADIVLVDADAALIEAGKRALAAAGEDLLYARVDLVRHDGEFLLMELELIEPALYFRTDPASPERFAEAIASWLEGTHR